MVQERTPVCTVQVVQYYSIHDSQMGVQHSLCEASSYTGNAKVNTVQRTDTTRGGVHVSQPHAKQRRGLSLCTPMAEEVRLRAGQWWCLFLE